MDDSSPAISVRDLRKVYANKAAVDGLVDQQSQHTKIISAHAAEQIRAGQVLLILLSVVALCLGTTLLIKMQKTKYLFVTLVPLSFMCAVTFSAGYLKIFSIDPKLGFLTGAQSLTEQAGALADPHKAVELIRQASVWRFDALVAASFLVLVLLIVLGSAKQWWQLIRGTKPVALRESEFVQISQFEAARS